MLAYHFICERHGLDDLRRRRLKISRFADMNDPFECVAAALPTKRHRIALRGFQSDADRNWGVLCFSRNWNDPVLWSHYADRHRGMCLGFEIDDAIAARVQYATAHLPLNIDRQLVRKTQDVNFGRTLLTTKYSGWSYEDEVRVFAALQDIDPETGHYFAAFGPGLRLRTVVIGVRSKLSRQAVLTAISRPDRPVTIIKARLAFKTFRVVKQKNRALWTT